MTGTISTKRAILFIVILESLIAITSILLDGLNITALQTTTRFSGRLSLAIFSLIFILSGNPSKLNAWLSSRYFLVFAIAHGIHLVELLTYVKLSGTVLVPYRLAGGFLAYSMIFAMPYIYERWNTKNLSQKRYQILQNIYLYYVWFIFSMTYLTRVLGKVPDAGGSRTEHIILLGFVYALLVLKVINILMKRGESKFN